MKTKIVNGKLITPQGIVPGELVIENGMITAIAENHASQQQADETIDAEGAYVSPGFIDIHTHGAGGADYMDGTVDAYLTASKMQAAHGATLVYPTTVTSSDEVLFESFETYRKAVAANEKAGEGSAFGGFHLEGPYFNPVQAGAQNPKYLRSPNNPEEYKEILRRGEGLLKRWSFSPELEGAPAFAAEIKKAGIIASIGHTDATFAQCDAAYRSGASHMTHFFSCMSTVVRKNAHRVAGTVEYGYYQDGMSLEIIADGIHVPEELLKLIIKIKGVDKIAIITDSMRAAGMPEGRYILGGLADGMETIVEEGVAKLLDRSRFAGSVATTDRLLRTMINIAGCSIEDATKMATVNPARMMKVDDRKGSLEVGKDADIVIWDGNVDVKRTIINGKTVFKK